MYVFLGYCLEIIEKQNKSKLSWDLLTYLWDTEILRGTFLRNVLINGKHQHAQVSLHSVYHV